MKLGKLIFLLSVTCHCGLLTARQTQIDTLGNLVLKVDQNSVKISKVGGADDKLSFLNSYRYDETTNKEAMFQAAELNIPMKVVNILDSKLSELALKASDRIQISLVLSLSTNVEYIEIHGKGVHDWELQDYITLYHILQDSRLFKKWAAPVPYLSCTLPVQLKQNR